MGEAVSHSLQYLAAPDVTALVAYLRSLPAHEGVHPVEINQQPAPAAASTDTTPGGGGHSHSVVGSPPAGPAPTGPPSGGSGASAPGGSGLGLAGFIGFALLLLVAMPHAMRRLALSFEPWLTSFAVLIPERPD